MNFSQFLDLNITRIERHDKNCTLVPTTIFNKINSAKIRRMCDKAGIQQLLYFFTNIVTGRLEPPQSKKTF